jgi:hypothetical protein
MEKCYEYLIIGSGPAAAMAAQTLLESGKEVLVLDVGLLPDPHKSDVPDKDFLSIRRENTDQHRFLLGDEFETLATDQVKPAAQLTPARTYMTQRVSELTPISSDSFNPVESLAYGGLGVGWGLGCYTYSDAELEKTGLPPEEMRESYKVVGKRIGISAASGSLGALVNEGLEHLLPPLRADNSGEKLLKKAAKPSMLKKGFHSGLPSMAILSRDFENRKASSYHDMDFYADHGYSCWRPWMTFNELRKNDKLKYINNLMVTAFAQEDSKVKIKAINVESKKEELFYAEKILLGAGSLGNARIVLRSIQEIDHLPLLCNPYAYLPCLHISMIGQALSTLKTSMAQGMMIYDPDQTHSNLVSLAFYTYRSLLLHRLSGMLPLNYSSGLKLLKYLQSAFLIAGIHHPDNPSPKKFLSLITEPGSITGDILQAHYTLEPHEIKDMHTHEKSVRALLLRIGCVPLKRIDPGFGGSIHYGGTVPFSDRHEPGTQLRNGSLNSNNRVFILDASGFAFLPAKGVTLSIMANAHRVAVNAMQS